MSMPPVTWQTPRPLWTRFGTAAQDQARPVILRFAGDDFMEQLQATLARDPSGLDGLIARPETWRTPASTPPSLVEQTPIPVTARAAVRRTLAQAAKGSVSATSSTSDLTELGQTQTRPLKLYQPAHHRFYIVGASLSCAVPGLPERPVTPGGAEEVNFVLRRLLPEPGTSKDPADLREYAFVTDAGGTRWQRVDAGTAEGRYIADEERLPVFPLSYEDDAGKPRTLWGGLVPVGRREEYIAARVDKTVGRQFRAGQLLAVRNGNGASAAAANGNGATTSSNGSTSNGTKKYARVVDFQLTVAEPWKNLIRSSYKLSGSLLFAVEGTDKSETDSQKQARVFDHNLQQQNTSWLILLDFADYLTTYLPKVWKAIDQGSTSGITFANTEQSRLYDWLGTTTLAPSLQQALNDPGTLQQVRAPAASLRAGLKAIRAPGVREKLEGTKLNYTRDSVHPTPDPWPSFHFVLAGLDYTWTPVGPFQALSTLTNGGDENVVPDPESTTPTAGTAEQAAATLDQLTALVGRALEVTAETDAPPIPFAAQLRDALRDNVSDPGWFAVRFVYTRRDCGPLAEPELSARSQQFQLANFYDPDAPARPIRITLPADTSPAGLRKFNKNTAFVISDMLCGQVQRAKGLGFVDLVLSVLPWPFHKDLGVGDGGPCKSGSVDIGMICSLSIPIITICALILLIIMVSLFDFIFRWLPYFIMCFPLPKLSGKKATT
jgi:hypothetical protein